MNPGVSIRKLTLGVLAVWTFFGGGNAPSAAQNTKPNIVMLMTDTAAIGSE
jgi:hypothetical protein